MVAKRRSASSPPGDARRRERLRRPRGLPQRSGFDGVKDLVLAAAFFLNPIGIAIKHFENRQRLAVDSGSSRRHVKRRREGHHRVKADVIFAAKSAGVSKRARSDESPKLRPGFEPGSERRQQFVDGRFLHQADERFERAEVERVGALRRQMPEQDRVRWLMP